MNPKPDGMHARRPASIGSWYLALLLLAAASAPAQTAKTSRPAPASSNAVAPAAATSPYARIVTVGASVTAGFTESEPLGGPNTTRLRLDRYVEAALNVPHTPVTNLGNTFFFLHPNLVGRRQIDQALRHRPTLIIGLDFLFWFLYGEGRTDADRLTRFEQGLKLLETVECPLVLGDMPDASAAVNGMLRPEQMPSTNAIAAANRRLTEWAAGRPRVVIVSLSAFMRNALANRAIKLRGHTLPAGQTRRLIQDDLLHASPHGCAALALAALEAVEATHPESTTGELRRDPNEVYRLVMKSLKETAGSAARPAARQSSASE